MKRLTFLLFILSLSGILSCSGDMIEKGLESSLDQRLPDINVKQGVDDILSSTCIYNNITNIKASNSSAEIIITFENILAEYTQLLIKPKKWCISSND